MDRPKIDNVPHNEAMIVKMAFMVKDGVCNVGRKSITKGSNNVVNNEEGEIDMLLFSIVDKNESISNNSDPLLNGNCYIHFNSSHSKRILRIEGNATIMYNQLNLIAPVKIYNEDNEEENAFTCKEYVNNAGDIINIVNKNHTNSLLFLLSDALPSPIPMNLPQPPPPPMLLLSNPFESNDSHTVTNTTISSPKAQPSNLETDTMQLLLQLNSPRPLASSMSSPKLTLPPKKRMSISNNSASVTAETLAGANLLLFAKLGSESAVKAITPSTTTTTTQVKPKVAKVKAAKKVDTKLYCICRGLDDGSPMVQCFACDEWYHIECMKLDMDEVSKLENYECSFCAQKAANGDNELMLSKVGEGKSKKKMSSKQQKILEAEKNKEAEKEEIEKKEKVEEEEEKSSEGDGRRRKGQGFYKESGVKRKKSIDSLSDPAPKKRRVSLPKVPSFKEKEDEEMPYEDKKEEGDNNENEEKKEVKGKVPKPKPQPKPKVVVEKKVKVIRKRPREEGVFYEKLTKEEKDLFMQYGGIRRSGRRGSDDANTSNYENTTSKSSESLDEEETVAKQEEEEEVEEESEEDEKAEEDKITVKTKRIFIRISKLNHLPDVKKIQPNNNINYFIQTRVPINGINTNTNNNSNNNTNTNSNSNKKTNSNTPSNTNINIISNNNKKKGSDDKDKNGKKERNENENKEEKEVENKEQKYKEKEKEIDKEKKKEGEEKEEEKEEDEEEEEEEKVESDGEKEERNHSDVENINDHHHYIRVTKLTHLKNDLENVVKSNSASTNDIQYFI